MIPTNEGNVGGGCASRCASSASRMIDEIGTPVRLDKCSSLLA
jgi:hypothetical protein